MSTSSDSERWARPYERERAPGRRSPSGRTKLVLLIALLGVSCNSGSPEDESADSSAEPADVGTTEVADGSVADATTTATSLIVEPDDSPTAILDAIASARKSVHLEMYLLTSNDAIGALIAARKAGREVAVVLERSPYLATSANRPAYDQLTAAGVTVAWSSTNYALTHSKTMIVDAATAFVMTLNMTDAGMRKNREFSARVDDPADVAEAESIFAADLAGVPSPALAGGKLVVAPVNARPKLAALIDDARVSIDMEMEELVDDEMTGRLGAALARGVRLRIVVPGSISASMQTKLGALKASGAAVRSLANPDAHAKTIVVDAARAYLGSENLGASSLDKNREIGVITETPSTVARLTTVIDGDVAKGTAL